MTALDYTLQGLQAADRVIDALRAALVLGSADIAAVQAEAPFQGDRAIILPTFKSSAISLWYDLDGDDMLPQQYPAIWVVPSDTNPGSKAIQTGQQRGTLTLTLRLWVKSKGHMSAAQAPTTRPATVRVGWGLVAAIQAVLERDVVGGAGVYGAIVSRIAPANPPQRPDGVHFQAWDITLEISGKGRQSRGL